MLKKIGIDLLVVGFFAAVFAFFCFRINLIPAYVFDELYYVPSAQALYHNRVDDNFEHPLLSKFLIGLPFYVLGDTYSLAWRITPLLFGFSGLLVTYLFGRKIGLSIVQSMVAVLMLIFSGMWFTLSRVAMLDIFLAVFILVAGFLLYLYLRRNGFKRDFSKYHSRWLFVLYLVFVGLSASCKWTGFFPLFFVFALDIFYFNLPIKKFLLRAGFCLLISVATYIVVNLAILHFNFYDFGSRQVRAALFHVAATNPEQLAKFPEFADKLRLLGGGPKGVLYFLFYYRVYIFESLRPGPYKEYGLSDNQVLPIFFVAATLILLLLSAGYLIRLRQKIPMELPKIMRSPEFLFLYFYSFFLIVPWVLVSRIQYNFYYLPAFPFLCLMSCYFLFKETNWMLRTFLLLLYFGFGLYWFPLWIPL